MKISFLINNAYGIGGTIRSTMNLSGALAARHDVEIVSVHRVADAPRLNLDPRVQLRSLIEMRQDDPSYEGGHELTTRPNGMFPESGVDFGRLRYTGLHDERITAYLTETDADVVVATRPILNGYLSRRRESRYLRVGQEHLTYDSHSDQLRGDQNAAVAGLDAFVTVSEADAGTYRAALPALADRIVCVPNAVPASAVEPSDGASRMIVAAGRLVEVKRYDRLIDAFAKVAAQRPDWTLRIYGRGPQAAALRRRIDELQLYNQVFLMGAVSPIETEWAKGAVAAVSSDLESFGMTIVEAMHCGVPVVATDCPHGPGEIISHGKDGLLVPLAGGTDAYADALLKVIDNQELRRRLGKAAREKAATYAPAAIALRYERLFETLREQRSVQGADRPRRLLGRSLGGSLRAVFRRPAVTGATPQQALQQASQQALQQVPPEAAPELPPARPQALAAATADGGLLLRLDPATLPGSGPWEFITRLRRDPEGREIRLPLPPADAASLGSRLDVTVRRDAHVLAEGRWDCYVAAAGTDRRCRVVAELVEQARLLTLPPVVAADGLSSWIPYTTTDGFLALRAWLRPAHAEVQHVLIGEACAVVTAQLLGDARITTPDAVVRAVSREGEAQSFEVPVRQLGGDRFECTLPYADLMARRSVEHDVWDLRILIAGSAVRIGRITGDLPERKKVNSLPAVALDHSQRGATRVRAFFTVTNDLAVGTKDAAADPR